MSCIRCPQYFSTKKLGNQSPADCKRNYKYSIVYFEMNNY